MSEENLFKLFDKVKLRSEGRPRIKDVCEHLRVYDNVCDVCFEILRCETVDGENTYNRTIQRSKNVNNRVSRFYNILAECKVGGETMGGVYNDFKLFLRRYENVERKRKNFLLNRWVLWRLMRRRGVAWERYQIKNNKSRKEHEDICREIFDFYGWHEV